MLASIALRAVPRRHHLLVAQMFRFGVVGTVGFVVDTGVVYLLRHPLGLYGAGLVSFLVSVTVTWALNRAWTFRGLGSGRAHHQWAKFIGANMLGLVLNRGAYALLVTFSALCATYPVLATAGGAIAGMGVNFMMARRLVFR